MTFLFRCKIYKSAVYMSICFRFELFYLNPKVSRLCLPRVRTHTPSQILFVYSTDEALTGASKFWHFEKQYFMSSQINKKQNSLCPTSLFYLQRHISQKIEDTQKIEKFKIWNKFIKSVFVCVCMCICVCVCVCACVALCLEINIAGRF